MARVRTPAEVGALLHAARSARGWNQQQAATVAGVSRRFVSTLEGGEHANAELWRVLAVLDALGVELHGTLPAPTLKLTVRSAADAAQATDSAEAVPAEPEQPPVPEMDVPDGFDLDAHLSTFRSDGGSA